MSLPQFSFNLIYVSKLTRTLNCSISFFPDYCLIQDLSTKWIIGRGRESRGLYILEIEGAKVCCLSWSCYSIRITLSFGFLLSLSVEEAIFLVF